MVVVLVVVVVVVIVVVRSPFNVFGVACGVPAAHTQVGCGSEGVYWIQVRGCITYEEMENELLNAFFV